MGTTMPIRTQEHLNDLKNYFLEKGDIRDYVLIIVGIYTALRVSDLLSLRWKHFYLFESQKYKVRLDIIEQKTKKHQNIPVNPCIIDALEIYKNTLDAVEAEQFIFLSRKGNNTSITRQHASRIIKKAAAYVGIEENISSHSLRKTLGYAAYRNGAQPALLMSLYNHSSYDVTLRYISIQQEEKDQLFLETKL